MMEGEAALVAAIDAAWHPLADRVLCVLTADGLRMFDAGRAVDGTPLSPSRGATIALSPASFDGRTPAAIAFGAPRSAWEAATLFLVCDDGALFTLTPFVPPGALLPTRDWALLRAATMALSDADGGGGGEHAGANAELALAVRWIDEAWVPSGDEGTAAADGSPAAGGLSRWMRYTGALADGEAPAQPRLQGPFTLPLPRLAAGAVTPAVPITSMIVFGATAAETPAVALLWGDGRCVAAIATAAPLPAWRAGSSATVPQRPWHWVTIGAVELPFGSPFVVARHALDAGGATYPGGAAGAGYHVPLHSLGMMHGGSTASTVDVVGVPWLMQWPDTAPAVLVVIHRNSVCTIDWSRVLEGGRRAALASATGSSDDSDAATGPAGTRATVACLVAPSDGRDIVGVIPGADGRHVSIGVVSVPQNAPLSVAAAAAAGSTSGASACSSNATLRTCLLPAASLHGAASSSAAGDSVRGDLAAIGEPSSVAADTAAFLPLLDEVLAAAAPRATSSSAAASALTAPDAAERLAAGGEGVLRHVAALRRCQAHLVATARHQAATAQHAQRDASDVAAATAETAAALARCRERLTKLHTGNEGIATRLAALSTVCSMLSSVVSQEEAAYADEISRYRALLPALQTQMARARDTAVAAAAAADSDRASSGGAGAGAAATPSARMSTELMRMGRPAAAAESTAAGELETLRQTSGHLRDRLSAVQAQLRELATATGASAAHTAGSLMYRQTA